VIEQKIRAFNHFFPILLLDIISSMLLAGWLARCSWRFYLEYNYAIPRNENHKLKLKLMMSVWLGISIRGK
jgi:hypothetical protein